MTTAPTQQKKNNGNSNTPRDSAFTCIAVCSVLALLHTGIVFLRKVLGLVAVWFWADQESVGMIYRLKSSHFQLWSVVI